jgi:hypothetical protein
MSSEEVEEVVGIEHFAEAISKLCKFGTQHQAVETEPYTATAHFFSDGRWVDNED